MRKEADLQAQKLLDEASSKGPVAKLAAQKAAETIRRKQIRKPLSSFRKPIRGQLKWSKKPRLKKKR